MNGKLKINATLRVLTGMHIGGSSAFSAIGAVDSPVVSDPRTHMPIVPGSTLKGKLLFAGLFAKLMPKSGDKVMGGFEMNEGMMSMLGGFTVLRITGMVGTMGINFTKEELLDLNAKLNKIKKPN